MFKKITDWLDKQAKVPDTNPDSISNSIIRRRGSKSRLLAMESELGAQWDKAVQSNAAPEEKRAIAQAYGTTVTALDTFYE